MGYKWRITLTSGKEYVVTNEMKEAQDMITYICGTMSNVNTMSYHQTDISDSNKCRNVVINSAAVESVEFNLK
ncbi:hypothetical protein [Clostridium sp.]|uniref:hypothetical protein n=1 Tax=Clostridium sp. TaxID=1506 RepID=UPI001A36FF60|nr:hypothetical protein [Clostridium sp.]MBK5239792.1 hypothetical protein [Clostridium sp.]